MSGAAEASSNSSTTKATIDQSQQTPNQLQSQKPAQQLEEDDEFEDFPVEGMFTHFATLRPFPALWSREALQIEELAVRS